MNPYTKIAGYLIFFIVDSFWLIIVFGTLVLLAFVGSLIDSQLAILLPQDQIINLAKTAPKLGLTLGLILTLGRAVKYEIFWS